MLENVERIVGHSHNGLETAFWKMSVVSLPTSELVCELLKPSTYGLPDNRSAVRAFGGSADDRPLNTNLCTRAPGATSAL